MLENLSYSTNFAPVSAGIYFISGALGSRENSIQFFEFATGKRKTLLHLEKPFSWGVALSPDHLSLLYSLVDRQTSNLMLVEQFH